MKTILILLTCCCIAHCQIGRKLGNMKYKLTRGFTWEKTKNLLSGEQRWLGTYHNGTATIECVGNSGNLTKVTFLLLMTLNDYTNGINVLNAKRFVRNALPHWGVASGAWVKKAIDNAGYKKKTLAEFQGMGIDVYRPEGTQMILIIIERLQI